MKKIYIVTGGTGFVGNNVVKKLEDRGETVVALARDPEKVKKALAGCKAAIVYGDVRNPDDLEKLFINGNKSEYVFIHTASLVHIGNDKKIIKEMFDINLNGAKNVVEVCKKHKCRLLYVSSVHAITEPKKRALTSEIENFDPKTVVGVYAKSKAGASKIVMDAIKNDGLDAVIVHPAGITGPNDWSNSHLTQMVEDFASGRIPAACGGGYDFVDVRDVADGILAAIEKGKKGERFLLSNKYYSVKELLGYLSDLGLGKKPKITMPIWLAVFSLPFLGLYFKIRKERPLYTSYSLYTLGSNSNFSHAKAEQQLGFKPRSLKESLADTVKFLGLKANVDGA